MPGSRLKIVFFISSLGIIGGLERVTIVKANSLAELRNCDVTIAFSDKLDYPNTLVHPISPKVSVVDLQAPLWSRQRFTPISFLNSLYKLRNALQILVDKTQPDVLISVNQLERYVFPFIRSPRNKMIKIREFHGFSKYRLIEKQILKGKTNIIDKISQWFDIHVLDKFFDFNALLTKEDLVTNFHGKQTNRYGYIHNPSTFPVENVEPQIKREKEILGIGRLTAQKNFLSLLRIWKSIKDKGDWKLRIIGDGTERRILENFVIEKGLSDSVIFSGFSTQIKQELQKSSIFAATSAYEGFLLTIIEAMACGNAVISYQTPCGPKDIINNNIDGILIPLGDEKAFAEKLQQLMNDVDLRERLAKYAIKRVDDFSVEKISKQWVEKYNELLAKKRYHA